MADGLKADTLVLPSLYLMFQMHLSGIAHGFMSVFIKRGVEDFLFNGADLMWPGILCLDSEQGFKQNEIVIVYAMNEVLLTQIDKIKTKESEMNEELEAEDSEPSQITVDSLLTQFAPVAVGRMATNFDKVTLNKTTGRRQGKAVLVDHVLFDQLWMLGDKKIPEKLTCGQINSN